MLSDYLKALQFSETARILHPHDAAPDARSVPAGRPNADGCISDNLDFFIAHHEDELFSLPVTSLFNIFQHESRHLTKQPEVYDIIKMRPESKPGLLALLGALSASSVRFDRTVHGRHASEQRKTIRLCSTDQ